MIQKKLKSKLKRIGLENMLEEHVVEAIFKSQFEVARKAVQEGHNNDPDTFKTVSFKFLGKLTFRPNQILKIKEKNEKKSNQQMC